MPACIGHGTSPGPANAGVNGRATATKICNTTASRAIARFRLLSRATQILLIARTCGPVHAANQPIHTPSGKLGQLICWRSVNADKYFRSKLDVLESLDEMPIHATSLPNARPLRVKSPPPDQSRATSHRAPRPDTRRELRPAAEGRLELDARLTPAK